MISLTDLKQANKQWFAPGNASFFGDMEYFTRQGASGDTFLVRRTNGWTDMFDGKKKPFYCINPIDQQTLEIKSMLDDRWEDLDGVLEDLKYM
jgi:hypothetical protein